MQQPDLAVTPVPASVEPTGGGGYEIDGRTDIHVHHDAVEIGATLATLLRGATGGPVRVAGLPGPDGGITLDLTGAPGDFGDEGYRLEVTPVGVAISAHRPAGLWYGVQTLRHLLPPAIEGSAPPPGPWRVPAVRIVDRPRFRYRGFMLDVARHFFDVDTVVRLLDLLALYKINHLHLHLTDDQGWRFDVDTWPDLARRGGASEVGGGPGGHYTTDDYRRIVTEAARRFITVVPEVDMPGHVHAALSAYPELAGDTTLDPPAGEPYTGTIVGFSSLQTDLDLTYRFVGEVFERLAALTPGPYLHLGGDEAYTTGGDEYARFVNRVQRIIADLGKTPMGWYEIAAAGFDGDRVIQYWGTDRAEARVAAAVARGAQVVLSPARHTYLDMKYDQDTPIGQLWAGAVEVRDAYEWEPGSYLEDVPEEAVLGVEAALWTETTETVAQLDFLTFPRLPAIAERAWSPAGACDWEGFRRRLARQRERWDRLGVAFHRSPQVPWDGGGA
jgi:hexosaminidase